MGIYRPRNPPEDSVKEFDNVRFLLSREREVALSSIVTTHTLLFLKSLPTPGEGPRFPVSQTIGALPFNDGPGVKPA